MICTHVYSLNIDQKQIHKVLCVATLSYFYIYANNVFVDFALAVSSVTGIYLFSL